ncbi:uncharacterized protein LOC116637680 [Phoca vitulina]|uniref:uncharacterized protein LOC116637680 n=1 Tax=Phoca vitulina TaxID=9720 RepID=UPI0013966482|nr:uncharacterized protein LOC116637680 [Phoca vitulina]
MGLLPGKAVALLGSAERPNNEAEAGMSSKEVKELGRNGSVIGQLPTACKPSPFLRASAHDGGGQALVLPPGLLSLVLRGKGKEGDQAGRRVRAHWGEAGRSGSVSGCRTEGAGARGAGAGSAPESAPQASLREKGGGGEGRLEPTPGSRGDFVGVPRLPAPPSAPGDPGPERAPGARRPCCYSYPALRGDAVHSGFTDGETEARKELSPKPPAHQWECHPVLSTTSILHHGLCLPEDWRSQTCFSRDLIKTTESMPVISDRGHKAGKCFHGGGKRTAQDSSTDTQTMNGRPSTSSSKASLDSSKMCGFKSSPVELPGVGSNSTLPSGC